MINLDNKRAVITGGTTGIGLATAKRFQEAGATVTIIGNNAERLQAAHSELGAKAHAVRANLSDVSASHSAIREATEKMGGVDILFLNAGIAKFAPHDTIDESLYNEMFDVNVKGVFFAAQAATPLMTEGGSIIATTSVATQMGMAGSSVYAGTKAAVASMVRVLASELASRKIRVNAISPGAIQTPIYAKLGMPEQELQGMAQHLSDKIPLGRFGDDDEIAKAVVFLASDASSYMTGSEMVVDGGWTGVML